jgi:hypothetical protein
MFDLMMLTVYRKRTVVSTALALVVPSGHQILSKQTISLMHSVARP